MNPTIPPRPAMIGGQLEQERSEHQAARWLVLEEEHQDLAEDWRNEHVPAEHADAWGPSDLAVNPLAEISTQLSTPGLYGTQPTWHHADAGAQAMVGPGGVLESMGYWTKMQRVEYYTRGLAEMVVRFEVASSPAEVVARLVRPSDVWVKADRQRPDRAAELAELRLMWWEAKERYVYVWEWFSLGLDTGEPAHRIYEAKVGGGLGEDLSEVFLEREDGTFGELAGDAYPYRYEDGTPFLPFVTYHLVDSGKFWNHTLMRGAHRGTLNAVLYWSYAGHCARAASGSFVMAAGLVPMVGKVDMTGEKAGRTRSAAILPGTVAYHDTDGETQPFVTEVGPGGNLRDVAEFASNYTMQIAVRMGLNPADVQRQHANPTSGAALYISNKAKREMSKRIEPLFRKVDLEAVRKVAALYRIAELGTVPETGYSVTYHHPPESPEEERDRRDDISWRREQGLLGPVQAYQELNPGTTREAAVEAIVRARQEEVELKQRLAEVGIEEPTPPAPPTNPPEPASADDAQE